MLGNFSYCNPTKLYFGDDSLRFLSEELHKYGPNVVLIYGGGSIKKNGIYEEVTRILQESGKNVEEIAGVMPNPTLAKLYEGIEIARSHHADLLLAVGGGSVCDYAKAVSVSVNCEEDPWEKYYLRFEEPACETLPVGCVLTMVGTGSEMNAGAVITNQETEQKIGHVFADERIMPKFAILNPRYTLTLPRYQMVSGIYDIFNHICEQYFSGEDDNVSDYISEGLMRAVLHASRIANRDPQDYEARSNLMWTASWALNTLVSRGKSTDWMVHMIGQSVGAYTNATHGMTLAAVSLPYYRHILPYGLQKFKRFAVNVWDVDPSGKTDEQVAEEGLNAMEVWMRELGLVMKISELGATEDMLEGIADGTIILSGGYKALDHSEIAEILKESM
ncbi:iron-containing alcohol dehydrogenase [uncultured Oscillibacter sp.]|uniref:iron-containing alcohol dehydrogenase n=1 Tax=uncultured Oscillibacter sp. TaxID=876091 RepID=UPI001F86BB9B|nr:iron-containing alcohol dehydrogenase [uncultured Oscillibacter sp.]HJB77272.1 iron-containing alcohol dehydrogenase [Candidatus Oscillibacter avistercoris]